MAHSDGVPATIFETEPYIEIHTGLQTDNSLCFEKRVIADELSDAVAYVPLDPPEVIDICAVTPTADVISPAAKIFKSYALEFLEDFLEAI